MSEGYQDRVVQEQSDLVEKINKLTAFLDTEPDVDVAELKRLKDQLIYMNSYNDILVQRIEAF